ncbi:response regulator [Paenibacillus albiflavus]|uniref:Response regulator n=1 Tax=Paenibacillus albiflavus TaxID=2545760 RepID=A0A4R4ELD1_9BACL|nr:response regulator [Paenibacillus albiflavus]TCZ80150.1 response regulator [Paenibacillus albiflavus]
MYRILIVDDEEILRMLISDTLEDLADVQIEAAEDGIQALAMLEKQEYDLMILDYMMPEVTGLELLNRLSPQMKARMKIIMLTAKAQETDRMKAMGAGASYYIPKPFSPLKLLELVEEILYGEPSKQE